MASIETSRILRFLRRIISEELIKIRVSHVLERRAAFKGLQISAHAEPAVLQSILRIFFISQNRECRPIKLGEWSLNNCSWAIASPAIAAESGSTRAAPTMGRIVPRNSAASLPTGRTRLFFFPRGAGVDALANCWQRIKYRTLCRAHQESPRESFSRSLVIHSRI